MNVKHIVVQVSGGKDSLVVLHKAKTLDPTEHRITALYNDMGDSFPHVIDHLVNLCRDWNIPLVISRPTRSVLDTVKEEGLPSDIVPIWSSAETDLFTNLDNKYVTRLQSGINCCNAHLYQPILQATMSLLPDMVWRGSKVTDAHVTAGPDVEYMGIKFFSPIWEWTDEMVFEYIDANEIPIPYQYHYGVNHSLDCMECTAWLDTDCEVGRAAFTRDEYPVKFEALKAKLKLVDDEIRNQYKKKSLFVKTCGV